LSPFKASWALLLTATACLTSARADEVLAFPGAEGYGRFAKGGRGGDVYRVVNLNDAGPGSLRQGIASATGPRTIVFDVSGTIELKKPLVIEKSFLTIAGQTAPGDGICLKDQTFKIRKAAHIIVRYLRVRLGDENKKKPAGIDAMTTDDIDHVIFDHLSTSWGIDSLHDLRRGGNFTLQWSIYAEALHDSLHEKGPHAMLSSFREVTANLTIHHNLMAGSRERHPTLGGGHKSKGDALIDFRNNVVYNLSGATNLANCRINFINNYYRPGPNAEHRLPIATKIDVDDVTSVFMAGNVFEGSPKFTANNYSAIDFDHWTKGNYRRTTLEKIRAATEFEEGPARPTTQSAQQAFELVLAHAGASLHRDAADDRLVEGVRDRTSRLINSQNEVGGWPKLASKPAPTDTDGDGIPDSWERTHNLDPKDPNDGKRAGADGFTNLEKYLNSLCPETPLLSNE
jgi:pectate lyase